MTGFVLQGHIWSQCVKAFMVVSLSQCRIIVGFNFSHISMNLVLAWWQLFVWGVLLIECLVCLWTLWRICRWISWIRMQTDSEKCAVGHTGTQRCYWIQRAAFVCLLDINLCVTLSRCLETLPCYCKTKEEAVCHLKARSSSCRGLQMCGFVPAL